jgi:hypothetical protein
MTDSLAICVDPEPGKDRRDTPTFILSFCSIYNFFDRSQVNSIACGEGRSPTSGSRRRTWSRLGKYVQQCLSLLRN